jgi:uncharacterized protein (DUF779 family)
MLAIPTRGTIGWNTVRRLLELQEKHPDVLYHIEAGRLDVSSVRNKIVQVFLQTDRQVLIQVDDDVVPRIHVMKMAESSYDIVGATYYVIRHELNLPFPCVFRKLPSGAYGPIEKPFGRQGEVECDAVATGCMAVKRKVFEHTEMKAPFAMTHDEHGVFKMSDDIAFCHRAKALGFTIAADYSHHADHVVDGVSMNRMHAQFSGAYQVAMQRSAEAPRIVTP